MSDEKKLAFIAPALFIASLLASVPFWGFVVFLAYCAVVIAVAIYSGHYPPDKRKRKR